MKRLFVLLAALAATSMVLVGSAFAGTAAGQGAQKAPLFQMVNGLAGPALAGSWSNSVMDSAGNVTITVHLQGAAANHTYYIASYDQNWALQVDSTGNYPTPVLTTNGQGNGNVTFTIAKDPFRTMTKVGVALFETDWHTWTIQGDVNPISPSA